jgi:hypothetical protein
MYVYLDDAETGDHNLFRLTYRERNGDQNLFRIVPSPPSFLRQTLCPFSDGFSKNTQIQYTYVQNKT